MRKNKSSGTSSRKSSQRPTGKQPLQINKETVRTLTVDELARPATGGGPAIFCPWTSKTTTFDPTTGQR